MEFLELRLCLMPQEAMEEKPVPQTILDDGYGPVGPVSEVQGMVEFGFVNAGGYRII